MYKESDLIFVKEVTLQFMSKKYTWIYLPKICVDALELLKTKKVKVYLTPDKKSIVLRRG